MKKAAALLMMPAWLLFAVPANAGTATDTLAFGRILVDFQVESNLAIRWYEKKATELKLQMEVVNRTLKAKAGRQNARRTQKVLLEKLRLMEQLDLLESQSDMTQLKIRYRKGIDLIRVIYEKILGLDHHFTGLHTYQYIGSLSNPHTYPEFAKAKETIEQNQNRRYAMRLPALLDSNPLVSGTFTLVSMLLGENGQKAKEEEVDKIACILDFTVRMNGELNTIRNETEFLKNANQQLKEDCQRLFAEYAKAAGYFVPLEECRKNDDWETLLAKLEEKMDAIENGLVGEDGPVISLSRELVNIEFATQRVAEFIGGYSSFIGQGQQYYQKFDGIMSAYQHEQTCRSQLPRSFDDLKQDINSTIDKFQNTYALPEIQGSRLKDLMYGTVSD